MMRIVLTRAVLFVAGLVLLVAALLPALAGPAGAAPRLLITETATNEPATRTSTSAPPTSTSTPAPPTSTSTTEPTSTSTPAPPSPTRVPSGGGGGDDDDDDPTATPTVTATSIPMVADPAITKSASRTTVQVGDSVDFSLSVTNLGNAPAGQVVVEDTLPNFLALDGVSATRGDVTVSGATVRVTIGDLAPGETVTITITARVVATAAPPDNSNVATVSSDSPTDDPANNSSSVSLITEAQATPTAAPPPPPASLPNTGASGGGLTLLAALGVGLIVASLLARRRRA